MLGREDDFRKIIFQTNESIWADLNVFLIDPKKKIRLFCRKLRHLKYVDFAMIWRVVNTTPLLLGFLLKLVARDLFYQCWSKATQKVLLHDFSSAHRLAKHQKLPVFLVSYILWQEDYAKIIDPAFDFGYQLFIIKQFIDKLHVSNRLIGVSDDNDLIILRW
jgi:hypothetical protein